MSEAVKAPKKCYKRHFEGHDKSKREWKRILMIGDSGCRPGRIGRLDLLMIQWKGDSDNRRESDHNSREDEAKANAWDRKGSTAPGAGRKEKRAKEGEEVNAQL